MNQDQKTNNQLKADLDRWKKIAGAVKEELVESALKRDQLGFDRDFWKSAYDGIHAVSQKPKRERLDDYIAHMRSFFDDIGYKLNMKAKKVARQECRKSALRECYSMCGDDCPAIIEIGRKEWEMVPICSRCSTDCRTCSCRCHKCRAFAPIIHLQKYWCRNCYEEKHGKGYV